MNWPFGFKGDFFYDVELSKEERFRMVESVALHFLKIRLESDGTTEGNAELNKGIVTLLRGMQLIEMAPPSVLIELISVQLGAHKRSRSLPKSFAKEEAAKFLAENPNASDRAVARGANAATGKIEWLVDPVPKLSHHSVKKWRKEKEFQQLVSEYRRK